jgi:hypothetical protein
VRLSQVPHPLLLKLTTAPSRQPLELSDVLTLAIFLSAFSAQKTHVKPQNHLTHYSPITYAWHFSYIPDSIMNI